MVNQTGSAYTGLQTTGSSAAGVDFWQFQKSTRTGVRLDKEIRDVVTIKGKNSKKPQKGFWATMHRWTKPFYNGDGKLSGKEAFVNIARGGLAFVTEMFSSPKNLLIHGGAAVGAIGLGALAVGMGVVSAPVLLAGAAVVSGVFAGLNAVKAVKGFSQANGNEKNLAKAYFHTGESIRDFGIGLLAGHASHAAKTQKVGSVTKKALKAGGWLADNTAAIANNVVEFFSSTLARSKV